MDKFRNSLQILVLVSLASYVKGNGCDNEPKCIRKVFGDKECYLFKGTHRNWEESKELCAKKNLQLAAVPEELRHSDFLKSFEVESEKRRRGSLQGRHSIHTQQAVTVWLGGIAKDLSTWEFVNGEKFFTTPDGAPRWKYEERRCGQLNRLEDKVQAVSRRCDAPKYGYQNYICRIGNEARIYKEKTITWFQARKKCLKFGGDLYYLTKQQLGASKNLTTELKHLTEKGKQYLVGFKNFRAEGIDGSEILDYIPNVNQSNDKSCISMNGTTGLLSDGSCSVNRYTLCQSYLNDSKVSKEVKLSPEEDEEGGEKNKGKEEDEYTQELSNDELTYQLFRWKTWTIILGSLLGVACVAFASLSTVKKIRSSRQSRMETNPVNPVGDYHAYDEIGLAEPRHVSLPGSAMLPVDQLHTPATHEAVSGASARPLVRVSGSNESEEYDYVEPSNTEPHVYLEVLAEGKTPNSYEKLSANGSSDEPHTYTDMRRPPI